MFPEATRLKQESVLRHACDFLGGSSTVRAPQRRTSAGLRAVVSTHSEPAFELGYLGQHSLNEGPREGISDLVRKRLLLGCVPDLIRQRSVPHDMPKHPEHSVVLRPGFSLDLESLTVCVVSIARRQGSVFGFE
jgi:hypothetical protein